jgi:hypothetical protein
MAKFKEKKVLITASDDELVRWGIPDWDVRDRESTLVGYDQHSNPVIIFVNQHGTEMIYIVPPTAIKDV